MSRRLAGASLALALALAGFWAIASQGSGHAEDRTGARVAGEPVCPWSDLLRTKRFRIAVVYLPGQSGCPSCDFAIVEKLESWLADPDRAGELEVVTAVERGRTAAAFGLDRLPGTTVSIPEPAAAAACGTAGPRPRILLLNPAGEILLARSIPALSIQMQLLDDELAAAYWWTAPVEPLGGGRGE